MSDTQQMVIVSKLIFFDNNNNLRQENLNIIDLFYNQDIHLYILARYHTNKILKKSLPSDYQNKIGFIDRGDTCLKNKIHRNRHNMLISMIGIVDQDAIYSFNTQIPLFNPAYLYRNYTEIESKVEQYGLPFSDYQDIIDCYDVFLNQKEVYFNINFENYFQVYSLHNANSYYAIDEEKRIKQIFQSHLKQGSSDKNQKVMLFILFNFIRFAAKNGLLDEVDYWGTFPSSNPENTYTSASFLKEALRKLGSNNPRTGPEILIRHSPMRAKRESANRLDFKSNNDFDTLIINPALVKQIKGKVVCIIDDYINNGYSAEATKHLLEAAGVEKIIFISFGKFGYDYYATQYEIDGDVSNNFSYKYINEVLLGRNYNGTNSYNPNNSTEILKFKDLL